MVSLWQRVVARFRRPTPASSAPVVPPAVLGVTPTVRRPVPVPAGATLAFRGFVWTPRGAEDEKGRITFVREVAVNGRVAEAEVTVLARELIKNADGTYVLGDR